MKAIPRFISSILICILCHFNGLFAQTGGTSSFEFLALTNSARIAGLGGNFAAIHDNDITLALSNPSLITPKMSNTLALSYAKNYTQVNYGYASYGRDFTKLGSFVGSLQFVDYGNSKYTDETGAITGNFKMGEYAFNLGWGRMLDSVFSIGANVKMLYSDLESYNSLGLAVDVAGSYIPNSNTCVSLLIRNVGRQLTTYTTAGVQPLPFEIQLGMSRRFTHVPFRISLLLQHLEKWDLTYTSSTAAIDPFTGQPVATSTLDGFADKAMRHIIIGGEFIPARFLSLRVGYNYNHRKELLVDTRPGTVGFSWGIGLNVSKFSFSYSRAAYHLSAALNYMTLTTNLGDWAKK